MPYTLSFDLDLGLIGLTLEAQLIDTTGGDVGAAVTTGFVEIGLGFYLFTHTAIPDGHRGGVKIQDLGAGTLRGFKSINPEEAENVNAKITSRATATEVWDEVLEGSFTARQIMRIDSAAIGGEAVDLEINAPKYKSIASAAKTRISAATDAFGNRSSVTFDLTDV